MKKFIVIFTGIIILLLACAKPPTEEMNQAIEALNRAENDYDAVTYAGNTLNRARESLLRMQEEAGSKRYDTAKSHAEDVVTYAQRAISEGRAYAVRARDEAANLLDSLRLPISETETALNNARTNNIQLDFNDLDSNLDAVKQNLRDAQQSLSENNFADAINRGQSIRSALGDINSRINEAAQALSKKS